MLIHIGLIFFIHAAPYPCAAVEFVIFGAHAWERHLEGQVSLSRSCRARLAFREVVVVAMLVELVVWLTVPSTFLRVGRTVAALRVIPFVLHDDTLCRQFAGLMHALPELAVIYAFMFVFNVAFSVFGFLLCGSIVGPLGMPFMGYLNLLEAMILPTQVKDVIKPYPSPSIKLFTVFFVIIMVLFWVKQILSVVTRAVKEHDERYLVLFAARRVSLFHTIFGVAWRDLSTQQRNAHGQRVLTHDELCDVHRRLGGGELKPAGLLGAALTLTTPLGKEIFANLAGELGHRTAKQRVFRPWQETLQSILQYSVKVRGAELIVKEIALHVLSIVFAATICLVRVCVHSYTLSCSYSGRLFNTRLAFVCACVSCGIGACSSPGPIA
jgi:hypothetical protein